MKIKKIAVVGISASGKSVFGRELEEHTGLPLFHMDNLFWRGKWESIPESEYLKEEQKLICKDKWIIEGYVDEKMSGRLELADLVIYLDYPGILCFSRVIWRWLKHRRVSRPELPKEALEELDLSFLWCVLTRSERPGIERALERVDQSKIVRVYSPRALREFMKEKYL